MFIKLKDMYKKYSLKMKAKIISAMPKFNLFQRIILYLSMITFAILSLVNVSFQIFTDVVGIAIYICAAISVFLGFYYVIVDIYKLSVVVKERIESKTVLKKIVEDKRLRTLIPVFTSTAINVAYAIFNGIIAIVYQSAWLGTMSAYYILLSFMRIDTLVEERKTLEIKDRRIRERKQITLYKNVSMLFIFMAIVLCGAVILLHDSIGGKQYPGYTIYIAAMFSFYKIINASINMIYATKDKSTLLLTIRRISYTDACFSILTLQTAMLASFSNEQQGYSEIMNTLTGSVVCIIVFILGIQGILSASKKKKELNV